jgi:uncharacterized membrane protein YcaP (DUF421 family)
MIQEIIHSSLRTILGYFLLLVLTRIMERKLISQLTFFEFVMSIVVGSVVANLAVSFEKPVVSGVVVLIMITILTVTIQFSIIKTFFLRKIIDFKAVVVIENGKINAENVKKVRLRIDNLMMMLRQKDAFNIEDVEFAVYERDGTLSVLKKSQKQPLTPSDMNKETVYTRLTRDLIIDGKILDENLQGANLDRKWLMDKLKANNFNNADEVFYAGLTTSGNLYMSSVNKGKEEKGQYGVE